MRPPVSSCSGIRRPVIGSGILCRWIREAFFVNQFNLKEDNIKLALYMRL